MSTKTTKTIIALQLKTVKLSGQKEDKNNDTF